jgi:RNA polymerase sigma factor (sigma-70 family)
MVSLTSVRDESSAGLIRLAVDGDEVAFARIVDAYHDDMSSVCFVVTGGDSDLTEEAVQSAWPIAWRKLRSVREPERLRPWLISIAVNQARQISRRRRRGRVLEIAVATDSAREERDPGSLAADIDLRNALTRLGAEDRALVALRYVAGFDSSELAAALGMSASGTRARLARVLARLRSELSDG